MKFVRIRSYYINTEKINYVNTSVYLENYRVEIFFDNAKSIDFTTKDKAEFNTWLILLTGKGIDD